MQKILQRMQKRTTSLSKILLALAAISISLITFRAAIGVPILMKRVLPGIIHPGDTATFTLNLSDALQAGNAKFTYKVEDFVPAPLVVVEASATTGPSTVVRNGNHVTWTVGPLSCPQPNGLSACQQVCNDNFNQCFNNCQGNLQCIEGCRLASSSCSINCLRDCFFSATLTIQVALPCVFNCEHTVTNTADGTKTNDSTGAEETFSCTPNCPTLEIILPEPTVSISGKHKICSGQKISLCASVINPDNLPLSYSWTKDSKVISTDKCFSKKHARSDDSGTYTVVVTNCNGCSATDCFPLCVGPCVPDCNLPECPIE